MTALKFKTTKYLQWSFSMFNLHLMLSMNFCNSLDDGEYLAGLLRYEHIGLLNNLQLHISFKNNPTVLI